MGDEGLRTGLVFIDTSSYENKNFQFGQHVLAKLEEFADSQYIRVLLPDVIDKEVMGHIISRAEESLAAAKKINRDLAFLSAFGGLPREFSSKGRDKGAVLERAMAAYEEFKATEEVELLETSTVDSGAVFDRYFSSRPPFGSPGKKHEFPDAFALEIVRATAEARSMPVYVVSSDKDMERYCEEFPDRMIYLERLDDFIGLVNKYEADLAEPARLASKAFEALKDKITEAIGEALKEAAFSCSDLEEFEYEVADVDALSVAVEAINIIDSERDGAEIELTVKVDFCADFTVTDYDSSPWDPEDKCYIYLEEYELSTRCIEAIQVYVCLRYENGLIVNAEIDELWLEDAAIDLSYKPVREQIANDGLEWD
ncbi:hypothetical protein SAMN05216601_103451 [Ectopseudomonas composti]|uniref:DUF4935 domain-containing protein n=1 Tax=Ectopseudomonas composti TaxID=658457 RepID=A0A1I5L9U9_9GAMM|nr:PIN domain-containing protein [Pseudomonas composti]SFO94060.1 hypothetical protein SAMN05216601_103451 [Pseudomonas composti]